MAGENERPNWLRDVLAIPIIVGLLVAVGTYVLPKLLEKGKRLSYEIVGPIPYVNSAGLTGLSITFNGVPVTNVYGYRVRLWNSGGVALTSLPVQIHFSASSDFQILNVTHGTIPAHEFGKIDEQGSDKVSKRFVYELLNPEDEDTVTLVTNQEAPLAVYAKADQLSLRKAEGKAGGKSFWLENAGGLVAMLAFAASLLTSGLKSVLAKIVGKRANSEGTPVAKV